MREIRPSGSEGGEIGIPTSPTPIKGYSYPEVRGWLRRHHIQAVIPTRKDQTPDPQFEKATYRRRNLIERVVGWFKECRALGTRYEKLAVSYLALWIVAMIDKLSKGDCQTVPSALSQLKSRVVEFVCPDKSRVKRLSEPVN